MHCRLSVRALQAAAGGCQAGATALDGDHRACLAGELGRANASNRLTSDG